MSIFRFKTESFDPAIDEDKVHTDKGFVFAEDWGQASKKIEKTYTNPNGECSLISVSLYEVEDFDGLTFDDMIKETFDYEKGE